MAGHLEGGGGQRTSLRSEDRRPEAAGRPASYLDRNVVLLSLLEDPRGINFTDVKDEMNSNLQELTQNISNH